MIGGHSHVPGVTEVYRGRSICYSTGNFYFPVRSPKNPWWHVSTCIDIETDGDLLHVNHRRFYFDQVESSFGPLNPKLQARLEQIHIGTTAALADSEEYAVSWRELCARHRHRISSIFYVPIYLRGMTRLLRLMGLSPRKLGSTAQLADYDILHCESHLDILREVSSENASKIR